MGVFDVFKKKEDVPPDIGRENSTVVSPTDEEQTPDEEEEAPVKTKAPASRKGKRREEETQETENAANTLEFQKIQARLESTNNLVKATSERLSLINQQIGELRAMYLTSEKSIAKVSAASEKAVSIVEAVKPERVRFDVQKAEMKVEELNLKLASHEQFTENIMNEVKDLRRKAGTFIGTEALLKLNDEVKKDLLAAQQIAAKTRLHADKTEQLFITFNRQSANNEKTLGLVHNLDATYGTVKKEVDRLRLDFSLVATKDNLRDTKEHVEEKLAHMDGEIASVVKMREEQQRMAHLLESTLAIAQQNKHDIEDIALSLGNDHIKRVADYDERMRSVLRIVDTLAGQISEIKKEVGMKGAVSVPSAPQTNTSAPVALENIKIHPNVIKPLLPQKAVVSKQIVKITQRAKNNSKAPKEIKGKS